MFIWMRYIVGRFCICKACKDIVIVRWVTGYWYLGIPCVQSPHLTYSLSFSLMLLVLHRLKACISWSRGTGGSLWFNEDIMVIISLVCCYLIVSLIKNHSIPVISRWHYVHFKLSGWYICFLPTSADVWWGHPSLKTMSCKTKTWRDSISWTL